MLYRLISSLRWKLPFLLVILTTSLKRGHDNNNNQNVKKTGRARGALSTTLGKHAKTRSRLLQVSTREFLVESFLVVDEPIITLLVAHSLGRTLWGESVIGSRICANINQRERGKTAW